MERGEGSHLLKFVYVCKIHFITEKWSGRRLGSTLFFFPKCHLNCSLPKRKALRTFFKLVVSDFYGKFAQVNTALWNNLSLGK